MDNNEYVHYLYIKNVSKTVLFEFLHGFVIIFQWSVGVEGKKNRTLKIVGFKFNIF